MTEKLQLKSYHFSLGDSTKGAIGYCARIRATSKEKAVEILKASLPCESKIVPCGSDEQNKAVQYIETYFNPDHISAQDVFEVDDSNDK
jgi:hypothetical protein